MGGTGVRRSRLVRRAERGRGADGIDQGRVSENSGAESNIVAAEALLDDALDVARVLEDPFAHPPVDLPEPG